MSRRPPRSTRTDTLVPYTTLFRSQHTAPAVENHDCLSACLNLSIQVLLGGLCVDFENAVKQIGTAIQHGFDQPVIAGPLPFYHVAPYRPGRSEEHTSELQSLMRISYAVFCLKKKTKKHII